MKRRTRNIYTDAQKAEMWSRWQKGDSMHDIAGSFDRYHSSIQRILTENGVTTDVKLPQNRQSKIPHPYSGDRHFELVDLSIQQEASTTTLCSGGLYRAVIVGVVHDLRFKRSGIVQQGDALSKCLFLWSKQVSALHRAY